MPADPTRVGSVYHRGEVTVQEQAGVRPLAERNGRSIHRTIPPVGAEFLRTRDAVFVATTDERGRPWASWLTGAPGFLYPVDERTVRIAATATEDDPLAQLLLQSGPIGLLAMDFEQRRRLRLNGTFTRHDDGGLLVRVDEVYSNCPKYIQARETGPDRPRPAEPVGSRWRPGLSDAQRSWIRRADTFFIATAAETGADMSHRGGNPGFVRVHGNRLMWGDYRGNSMFNTLGNLAVNPQAALLLVDFESGHTLQLGGRGRIDWSPAHAGQIPGAERIVAFDVDRVLARDNAFPHRFRLVQYSPANPDPA
jgi:predicted pyridoxine 5'-phosphate oxidase superfamily flavin-nucleotide-binding protein